MKIQTLQNVITSVEREIYDWQQEVNSHRFDVVLGKLRFVVDKLIPFLLKDEKPLLIDNDQSNESKSVTNAKKVLSKINSIADEANVDSLDYRGITALLLRLSELFEMVIEDAKTQG
jgi:hypothetical protein